MRATSQVRLSTKYSLHTITASMDRALEKVNRYVFKFCCFQSFCGHEVVGNNTALPPSSGHNLGPFTYRSELSLDIIIAMPICLSSGFR